MPTTTTAIGGSASDIGSKASSFLAIPGVHNVVVLIQVAGMILLMCTMGWFIFHAARKKQWALVVQELIGTAVAAFILLNPGIIFDVLAKIGSSFSS